MMARRRSSPGARELRDGADRERREIAFWASSESERPGAFSLSLLTHKMGEARVLLEKLAAFRALFDGASTIVELGGGQAWASCVVAHELGVSDAGALAGQSARRFIATDIAFDAVVSCHQWERQFDAHLDGASVCRSSSIPLADASADLVFAFAAAHHFGAHRRTFDEIARVLRPGGHALYLHEPACRRWIYPFAYRRVMAKRPVVPEDVLRYPEIVALAKQAGLGAEVHHAPTTTYRGPVETVYYLALAKLPPLQKLLPCTVDFVFTKP